MITNYSIKRGVLLFKAIACPDKATSVQRDERYFESDIPSCRKYRGRIFLSLFQFLYKSLILVCINLIDHTVTGNFLFRPSS